MKLVKARVTHFRNIEDTGESGFSLERVTCLVGKNESGKTAILQALEVLNPVDGRPRRYDKLRDYPRRFLTDYEERHNKREALVLHTEWELEQPDIADVESELGRGALKSKNVSISKAYEHDVGTWGVTLDQGKVKQHLFSACQLSAEQKQELAILETTKDISKTLAAKGELPAALKNLQAKIQAYREQDAELHAIDVLHKRLPRMMYFSNYDRMSGQLSIDAVRQTLKEKNVTPGDQVFLDFLAFAGTSIDDITGTDKFEHFRAKIEAASNSITQQIFEYWTQNKHLEAVFTTDIGRAGDPAPFNSGLVMRARIYNQLHKSTVPFDERSAGFTWFFSFLVKFSQLRKKHEHLLILLDEPGLSLHATAQGDLLRYFKEKLAPVHQVIYTTHSPFMVPPDNLLSAHTVEDVVEYRSPTDYTIYGAKVGDEVLSTDRDTLFPLQGALGYEITQTLFVGPNTLLVEGPGDILTLTAASNELKRRGRTCLDSRWTLCPSGGIDKVPAFLSLFGGNKLNVAILADFAVGNKSQIERIRKSELLAEERILLVSTFTETAEADIEDLIGEDIYPALVNEAFALPESHKITKTKLAAVTNTPRLLKKVETLFRLMPPDVEEFDHYQPALALIRERKYLEGDSAEVRAALERFEKVFAAVNAFLPK
jgi:predicted ATP-dependent endonuclease of OLD family